LKQFDFDGLAKNGSRVNYRKVIETGAVFI
jgi:hypothetical protein